jgi:DNA mismatch repair protein MutL
MDGPRPIRVLPDLLVNKIAAGEVVERPASVVKELIENSLDAGATRISVAIEEGGARLIRVTDDGCGLGAEDLRLAITPHATSKIQSEDELYSIRTMGFRGEALASIGAVSNLRMISRLPGAVEGHEVTVCGDRIEATGAAGCPEGTTVEVRDLFFNVPARRKFLRSTSTETGHVNEQFTRLALAYPDIAFAMSSNGRSTHNLPPAEDHLPRIAKLYGPELTEALLPVERDERGLRIHAYLAPPVHSRAAAQWQYVYVNGRFVRDRFVQHAIREAYRGLMEPNRHGVVFLFLHIDPSRVDVNVHPSKIEVRWADSNLIHSQVLSALRETLQRADLTPALKVQRPSAAPIDEQEQDRIRHELAAILKSTVPIGGAGSWSNTPAERTDDVPMPWSSSGSSSRLDAPGSGFSWDGWRSMYGVPQGTHGQLPEGSDLQDVAARALAAYPEQGMRRAVQMHNLYLVAETDEGIMIVDQHALHERVMYEQFRQRFTAGPLESQRLLLPETIRVTAAQAGLLESHADLLAQMGIEVTPFGTDSVALHAVPALLRDLDAASFLRDLLDRLALNEAPNHTEALVHDLLDMMACKAAVKAGDPLTQQEINALMEQRHLVDKSSSCPHGRPTMLRFTKAELNRQFKRT